ncbi:MAG TPA: hypothetical protein PLE10_05260 [Brevefilum sp.]|nr:hypothetical protein [Brevefilum sp.]HOR19222.1 hypothetical protein [Brevefilum sp.]HPL69450.1 hypothetical protein [Brevefilum sp.]
MATLEDNPAGWQYVAGKRDPAFIDGTANFAVFVLSELFGLWLVGIRVIDRFHWNCNHGQDWAGKRKI